MREAYRLNKLKLYDYLENKGMQCALFIIYLSNEIRSFKIIENKIISSIDRLIKEHEKINQ